MSCQAYYSNRTEILFQRLKAALFDSPTTPFSRRIIVVPSPGMKSWLMLQMARDPDLGIAAGCEIIYLEQAVCSFLSSKHTMPSSLELSLALEIEIRKIANSEDPVWFPLQNYLKLGNSTKLSRKTQKRLTALCDTLAGLFTQYGKYGGEMENLGGWQEKLWHALFEMPSWTYPYKEIASFIEKPVLHSDIQIHVFAVSFLPALYHRFFSHLGSQLSVNYYLLSPCQAFWSDILSDRERYSLQAYWKKRRLKDLQQDQLETFLRDRNPLLANFGKLGREMAVQIEESDFQTAMDYRAPNNILAYPQYEPLLCDEFQLEPVKHTMTLLESIQADMLLLTNPEQRDKIQLAAEDRSIQVHLACSPMREMQVLHDVLLNIVEKHADGPDPIFPSDIMVMIPGIEKHVPFIQAVFEGSESAFEAQIIDLPVVAHNSLIKGYLHLLSISQSRWEASSIKQLLDDLSFQKKHSFSAEDVVCIHDWIDNASVRWGLDPAHRNELLSRECAGRLMIDNSSAGTWEHAIEQLMQGLIFSTEQPVESTQAELLGKWIDLLRSLHADLQCLQDGTEMLIQEWASYLRCLYEAYFICEDKDAEAELLSELEAFQKAGSRLPDAKLSFYSIKHHLNAHLNGSTRCYKEHALNAIRFCSMLPMRAIPAKVIVVAGMQEDAFPRVEQHQSLNLLQHLKGDYCPSSMDFDRFLFLEALLSARRYFIMTYHADMGESNEQPPSLVVTELLKYIDSSFAISYDCLHRHPFHPFDRCYFSSDAAFPSYSERYYLAAKAFYEPAKAPPKNFMILDKPHSIAYPKELCVDVRELSAFARNPIKTFLNKSLGIYLQREEERYTKNDEDFHLSSLQRFLMKQDALHWPAEQIWKKAETEGKLPLGAFKDVAFKTFEEESELLRKSMASLGISRLFSITCSLHVEEPMQTAEGHWHLPPATISHPNGTLKILGTIANISEKGMVVTIEDKKDQMTKVWPQFLLLSHLAAKHSLPITSQIFAKKDQMLKAKQAFFSDPYPLLQDYLEHYLDAQQRIFPFMPEWIPPLLEGKNAALQKALESVHDGFYAQYNPYLKWAMREESLPSADLLIAEWQPRAKQLFEELFKAWYPSRNGVDAC